MTATSSKIDTALSTYRDRLAELLSDLKTSPTGNPVSQLAYELSVEMESGGLTMDDIASLVDTLALEAFDHRVAHVARYTNCQNADLDARITALVDRCAAGTSADQPCDFDTFVSRFRSVQMGVIFTAHPTFLLARKTYEKLASRASGKADASTPDLSPHSGITLAEEHEAAMIALTRAKDALDALMRIALDRIAALYPNDWRKLPPAPMHFGTWVGYDLDGRDDVTWTQSLRFRLEEKALQIGRYIVALERLDSGTLDTAAGRTLAEIAAQLEAAFKRTEREIAAEADCDTGPKGLTHFSEVITAGGADRLTSLDGIIAKLEEILENCDSGLAASRDLLLLVHAMKTFRLGAGEVHFRLNATQLINAVRREFDLDQDLDRAGRRAITRLAEAIDQVSVQQVNFASIELERATAIRQFVLLAQIQKHVDSDSAIRMLIAECENPLPPLAAAYFASQFGVDKLIDISPLFETPHAMEHGDLIIANLLKVDEYRAIVERRGRLCVQTGFSDAGRFLGQIPATLAIERLQAKVTRRVAAAGVAGVDLLFFNTHGESMGRGCHPGSIHDRVYYVLSPWARAEMARHGLRLIHETSFQGGDGYVFFGTDHLATATLVGLMEAHFADVDSPETDPFYADTDISLDLFNNIRAYQEDLLEAPQYHRAVTAFGLSLLPATGSRKSRRQSEIGGDGGPALRKIRAIPHNAVLQQLGYPVNVIAGLGTAAQEDGEAVRALLSASPRMKRLIALIWRARSLGSLKAFGAYGQLFDPAFWATRPTGLDNADLLDACAYLARLLDGNEQHIAMMRLVAHLRVDDLMLRDLLATGELVLETAGEERLSLDLLHSLRLAIIQHIFLLAARIPPFSPRNDVSREDIMHLVFALRIDEAVTLLSRAYPINALGLADYDMAESADYPAGHISDYAAINEELIEPLAVSSALLRRITIAIACHFNAFG